MLFDTPNLKLPSNSVIPVASPSNSNQSKKRKQPSNSSSSGDAAEPQVNLDKLFKKLKTIEKDSGYGGQLGSGGKSQQEGEKREKGKGKMKKRKEKRELERDGAGSPEKEKEKKPHRFEPAKKPKQPKNKKHQQREESFASSANSIPVTYSEPLPSSSTSASTSTAVKRKFSAPTDSSTTEEQQTAPQTALQKQLRAKLSGGKFRMLNESLYTTTGSEAWETMKEEGAFDDYHTGFRSQSSHWPTNPLSIFTSTLSQLPPLTLIADFGCGDAALARNLSKSGQKVISLDLVSKDGWVVEAECSSVPLPGSGGKGGEIVDVVVCCLSLMGTDWVGMVREARRVLVQEGQLKIAEVTSRFTDVDAFVALITSLGFTFVSKDTSNTHFILFDFTRSDASEDQRKKKANEEKGKELLKPCIYKRR